MTKPIILEFYERQRTMRAAAIDAMRAAAASGDQAASEKWSAVQQFAAHAQRTNPGWLLAHPEWNAALPDAEESTP